MNGNAPMVADVFSPNKILFKDCKREAILLQYWCNGYVKLWINTWITVIDSVALDYIRQWSCLKIYY